MNTGWILVGLLVSSFEVNVPWTDKAVEIDGLPKESIWKDEGQSDLKAAWDRNFLYLYSPNKEAFAKRCYFEAKGKVVSFQLTPQGILKWGAENQPKVPSQAQIKIVDQAVEMGIPWVEYSALGARPDPGSRWTFGLGTKLPRLLQFSLPGRSSQLVGFLPWSGSPEPGLPF